MLGIGESSKVARPSGDYHGAADVEQRWWCPGADLNHRHADFQYAALTRIGMTYSKCRLGTEIGCRKRQHTVHQRHSRLLADIPVQRPRRHPAGTRSYATPLSLGTRRPRHLTTSKNKRFSSSRGMPIHSVSSFNAGQCLSRNATTGSGSKATCLATSFVDRPPCHSTLV